MVGAQRRQVGSLFLQTQIRTNSHKIVSFWHGHTHTCFSCCAAAAASSSTRSPAHTMACWCTLLKYQLASVRYDPAAASVSIRPLTHTSRLQLSHIIHKNRAFVAGTEAAVSTLSHTHITVSSAGCTASRWRRRVPWRWRSR